MTFNDIFIQALNLRRHWETVITNKEQLGNYNRLAAIKKDGETHFTACRMGNESFSNWLLSQRILP